METHARVPPTNPSLKCLSIQNSRLYQDVTKIQDAIDLAEAITKKNKEKEHAEEMTEEFEDAAGNVFNRKTYLDLKRQGLL
jgi:splicing factor 3A subunit 3